MNRAARSDCNRYVSEASLATASEDDVTGCGIVESHAGRGRGALVMAMELTSRKPRSAQAS